MVRGSISQDIPAPAPLHVHGQLRDVCSGDRVFVYFNCMIILEFIKSQ